MSRFGRMWRANNLLFVVLCLTKLTSGDKIIDERLSIFQKIDKFVSGDPTPKGITNVKIMGGDGIQKEFRIYMYSSPSNLEFDNFPGLIDDYTDKKSMMLYICISCVFAEWVENQLIELVKRIPSMYKTVKTDENDVLWNISELKEHFEYIRKMTKRFINILFNFINVHSYNTVSSLVDMSLLRLLVSKILINYLSMDTTPEVNIVTNILKIVNEAQTFLAFNCDVVSSYYDNKYFFSYSMTKTKTDKNHIDIDDFLNILTTFNLETPLEQCSAKQMLLGNIFSSENAVSTELRHNVELRVMKKKVKIDKDLFMKINQSVDLDVIYWYTNIILDVIIRIFCMKTSYYLDENTIFDQKIIEGFQKLSFFFTELTIDSEEVIEGFNFLASNQEITMAKRKELTKLMTNYFERSSENRGPENDSSQWFPSFAIKVDEQATDDNLDTFMDLIMNQIFDYKCFINIFNLLTIEHKQNYLSQRRDPSKVYEFVYDNILEKTEVTSDFNDPFRQVSIDNSMCKLVINMYEYCVEYCVTLIWDQNSPEEKTEENKEEVSEIIYGMLEALNHIYDKRMIRDRFQFELLLNIMPILEIKRRQITNFESQNNIELIRFLYIIMIELNKYGLEACTRDKDENLFFNRINYDTMGVHPNKSETIKDKLIKFIPVINEPIIVGTLPNLNYWLENMKTFCFNKSIQLYWRGEHKTFNQIYDSLIHHIWSPHYVYELYDVYFKFEMAQLFYKANRLIHNMRGNIVSSRSFFSNIMIRVDRIFMDFTTIPTEFTMALKKFTIEGLGHTLRCDYDRFPFDELYTTVENILKKLGINIVKELPCSDSTPTYRKVAPEPINPEERKKKIINDLNEYLVHTSKTIEMIKIAEAEYLKFKNLYNHINVQYNFRK